MDKHKNLNSRDVPVQWLRLRAPNAEIPGWIPGQGTKSYMLQLRPSAPK